MVFCLAEVLNSKVQVFIADHKHKGLWAGKGLFSTALVHDLGYCAVRMLCTGLGSSPWREENQSLSGICASSDSGLPDTLEQMNLEERRKNVFIFFLPSFPCTRVKCFLWHQGDGS